jgi:hypothetical protein
MAEMRTCIGSKRFGIEAHEAAVENFPSQPSQKDGLGRMCKSHWNQYTAGLARDAKARKAAAAGGVATEVAPTASEPAAVAAPKGRRAKKTGTTTPEPIKTRVPRGRAKAETAVIEEPATG